MLGKEDFMVIPALVRRGVYVCDIARQLGYIRRRSVGRWRAGARRFPRGGNGRACWMRIVRRPISCSRKASGMRR